MTWFQQQRKSTKPQRSKRHWAHSACGVCKHHSNQAVNCALQHTAAHNLQEFSLRVWANMKDPWELWAVLGGCLDLTPTFPHSTTVTSSFPPFYTDLQKVEGQWEEPLKPESRAGCRTQLKDIQAADTKKQSQSLWAKNQRQVTQS